MSEPHHSWKFWLGIFFLVINFPIGLASLAMGAKPIVLDIVHGKLPSFSLQIVAALAVYALSWLMLLAGGWLAGPAGKAYVHKLWLRYRPWSRKEAEEPKA